jgi:predicted kinase
MAQRALQVVQGGHAAIVDAVYARVSDREAIEGTAAAAGVPFVGIWLGAPASVLIARSGQRHLDASDADAAVIQMQLARDMGAITWHRIDASRAPDEVLRAAVDMLRKQLKDGVVRRQSDPA